METVNETLSMIEAASLYGISKRRILELARTGKIEGAVRGEGRTASWTLPVASLDKLKDEGLLEPRRYARKEATSTNHTGSGQITLKEAAQRFGIGVSTLQKKAKDGELPVTEANLGPGRAARFVKPEDVAALGIKSSGRGRYPRKKKSVADKLVKAGKVSLTPPAPKTNLNSELLRMADMVSSGLFTVTRLSVGLEFVGPEE